MSSKLAFCFFLRINTHNTLVADTCMSLLRECGSNLVIKNKESDHYPGTFKTPEPPKFNSGDILMLSDSQHHYQENPSKNRILRAFCDGPETADSIFSSFNRINMNTENSGYTDLDKPKFSDVIEKRFIPWVRPLVNSPFIFIAETRNPQIIVYAGENDKPFNWLTIHDEYTYLLIATQMSLEEVQDLLMPQLPGCFVFCMAVSGKHVAFHHQFLAQKYRRLEASCDKTAGKLRALAGVEQYLNRLSVNPSGKDQSEI